VADVLAPIVTIVAVGLFVGAWVFYLRRVRQNRADPVVDPSWPSNVRPPPRHLHHPSGNDAQHSLYLDPNEPEVRRREPESG
jgi:uncharacterized lipoprotein YddW (UPF0748 family)